MATPKLDTRPPDDPASDHRQAPPRNEAGSDDALEPAANATRLGQAGALGTMGIEAQPHAMTEPILVADDDTITRRILAKTLTKLGHDVVEVGNGKSAWELLAGDTRPRLAVLDWMMPGIDGPEICRRLRKLRDEPYTYVILLTGRTEKADLVEGMTAGADDYLTKPFDENELAVRLRAGLRLLELQSELVAAREQMRTQATHDPLTGILNRGAILDVLQSELNRGRRWNDPVAVVLADLDHFKLVNDEFGHLAGDETLREASRRMRAVLRDYDSLGRYGGEEFLVVLAGCWPQIARRIAERIRTVVAARPISTTAGSIHVTSSLGVAVCDWEQPVDVQSLVNAADLALYRAKERGRNRVVIAGYEDFTQVGNAS